MHPSHRLLGMAIASILNFFMPVSMSVVSSDCDFYQVLVPSQQYYIYNAEYSGNYTGQRNCRWQAVSPPGTTIVLSCEEIKLPSSTNCQADRLAISLSGDVNFGDARNYCGAGTLSLVTEANRLVVGLFSPSTSRGGKFVCALTAINSGPITSTTEGPIPCDCGWRQQTRIINGYETGINEYPSMSALIDVLNRDLFCGCSIISERYALTAAHCFINRKVPDTALLVGDHNISSGSDTPYAALYELSTFIPNAKYDRNTQQDDIGLVKTKLPIKFSSSVGPICLPFRYTDDDFLGQTITVLGWGNLDFSGPKSDTLQAADLTVVSNSECAAKIHDNPISSKQLCTYGLHKDACFSDSGGPVFWQDSSTRKLQQVGVISFGIGCATQIPGVNTRITSYLSWIVSVSSDAVYCIK